MGFTEAIRHRNIRFEALRLGGSGFDGQWLWQRGHLPLLNLACIACELSAQAMAPYTVSVYKEAGGAEKALFQREVAAARRLSAGRQVRGGGTALRCPHALDCPELMGYQPDSPLLRSLIQLVILENPGFGGVR